MCELELDFIECGWCGEKFSKKNDAINWYEIGFLCDDCEESMDDKTGYCSAYCQLSGICDHSC